MNQNNLDLFITAAGDIFNEIGFNKLDIKAGSNTPEKHDIVASIGITGDISGFLLIRSDVESTLKFVNRMLENLGMGATETDFGQFHKEAFGEILNQISGRATMLLENIGTNCNITPPSILIGKNITTASYAAARIIHKKISGDFGDIDLLVGAKF